MSQLSLSILAIAEGIIGMLGLAYRREGSGHIREEQSLPEQAFDSTKLVDTTQMI